VGMKRLQREREFPAVLDEFRANFAEFPARFGRVLRGFWGKFRRSFEVYREFG